MTTELVWSTVKPTFPEVKGKRVSVIKGNDLFISRGDYQISTKESYEKAFPHNFICYADLTAPVSPLPLWGKLPILGVSRERYYYRYQKQVEGAETDIYIDTPAYLIREKAILAWNRIAEALNEVER